jgi:hypothetical protein
MPIMEKYHTTALPLPPLLKSIDEILRMSEKMRENITV